jgi:hypothetical protein
MIVGAWNLENLFRPGGAFGPKEAAVYDGKLDALAATINAQAPDVLGVEEVGQPEALADLVGRLAGTWHTALSDHFDDHHPIRVCVLSRQPVQVVADTFEFRALLAPVQFGDAAGDTVSTMGRGVLAVHVQVDSVTVTVIVAHLKSKLLSFPGAHGKTRFNPHDEGERAPYATYACTVGQQRR